MKTVLPRVLIMLALVVGGGLSLLAEGPIISRSCVPKIGQVVGHRNALSTGVVVGTSGANQTWDYSMMTDSGGVSNEQYMNAAGTQYQSLYPLANVAVKTDNTPPTYTYFLLSDSRMEAYGTASSSDTDLMSDPRLITTFPREYHSSVIDSYAGRISGTSGIVYSATDSSYVDGYGTLKLPHGITYTNVARVMSNAYYTMAETSDTTKKYTFHTIHVSYFSPSFNGGALLSIGGVIFPGLGTRINSVNYVSDVGSDVESAADPSSISMQPNPTSDFVRISGQDMSDRIHSVNVCDLLGHVVLHIDAGDQNTVHFDLSALPSSMYYLRITMNSGEWQRQLCVVH